MKLLKDAGLSSNDAWDIYHQGWAFVIDETLRPADLSDDAEAAFVQYILEKVHLLHKRRVSSKVENSTGFLIEAIRQNYANPDYTLEIQSKAVAAAGHARRDRERQVRRLEAQKANLEGELEKELKVLCRQIAETSPEVLESAVPELMNNFLVRPILRALHYRHWKTTGSGPLLEMAFYPYLERHSPEQFQTIKDDYAARIAAIDAQIAALG